MTRILLPVAARFLLASLGAEAVVRLLFLTLPDELRASTDIVGYPTYRNFNIDFNYQ